jgi:hypothetical protein
LFGAFGDVDVLMVVSAVKGGDGMDEDEPAVVVVVVVVVLAVPVRRRFVGETGSMVEDEDAARLGDFGGGFEPSGSAMTRYVWIEVGDLVLL